MQEYEGERRRSLRTPYKERGGTGIKEKIDSYTSHPYDDRSTILGVYEAIEILPIAL